MSKPTTQPKTPTLKDLRRLAKRKVGRIDREKSNRYGYGALAFVFDWLRFSSIWINYGMNGSTYQQARGAMFSALSALPDAKGGQPKPGAGEVGK